MVQSGVHTEVVLHEGTSTAKLQTEFKALKMTLN